MIDYFRLPSSINIKLQKKVDTLRSLLIKKLNSEPYDNEELKKLDAELKKESNLLAEGVEDRIAEKETRIITDKLRAQLIKDGLLDDTD